MLNGTMQGNSQKFGTELINEIIKQKTLNQIKINLAFCIFTRLPKPLEI